MRTPALSRHIAALLFACATPMAWGTVNGGPLGHTAAFGEPGCDGFGCHRPEPLGPGTGRITIDVGPYVPGQRQRVLITITDTNARNWGFQLAVREMRDPQRRAGNLSVVQDDLFSRVRCASGGEPPCGNEMEYGTHSSVGAQQRAAAGFYTFRLDWTAPAADVGPVIFTAAGVGADGDLGTNGDRSYATTALSLFAPSNQPALREGGVVNAASFRAGAPISVGALVSLFGERLAPPYFSREVAPSDLRDGRLPIELNRIGADFIIPGFEPQPAYVLFVNETQMNVQVPAFVGAFTGRIEVQPVFNRGQGRNEVRGNRVGVDLQPVSPALFTFLPDNRSVAAVHSALPGGLVGRLGQFPNSRPARLGDVISVYGTGFGPTSPTVEPGFRAEGVASLVSPVAVRIGAVNLASADILYAGAAPTFAGLYQFNLRIPEGLGSGELPIVLNVRGVDSQPGVVVAVER